MVWYVLADSARSEFLMGELMFTAVFLGNEAPHSTVDVQFLYKMLHRTEADLGLLRVIGARAFVDINTHTRKLEPKTVEGRLVGYINNTKNCHVYHPATRRIIERKNTIFIETPSGLLFPPSEEPRMQACG